jgi:MFS family permease
LDQIGAVLGPLFVSFVLARSKNYHEAFLFLGIPAIISLAFLTLSIFLYPKPEGIEAKTEKIEISPASSFKLYLIFVFLTVLGFPHFQILSYHLKSTGTLQDETIPLLFALAMGLDAIFGLFAGFSFDRFKLRILFLLPILSAPITLFGFLLKGVPSVIMAVSLWGFVMGIHETVLKSAVAYIVSKERRAGAFGVFHTIYGVSWLLGSAVFGFLYELTVYYLLAFALISQILAFFVLIRMRK